MTTKELRKKIRNSMIMMFIGVPIALLLIKPIFWLGVICGIIIPQDTIYIIVFIIGMLWCTIWFARANRYNNQIVEEE